MLLVVVPVGVVVAVVVAVVVEAEVEDDDHPVTCSRCWTCRSTAGRCQRTEGRISREDLTSEVGRRTRASFHSVISTTDRTFRFRGAAV